MMSQAKGYSLDPEGVTTRTPSVASTISKDDLLHKLQMRDEDIQLVYVLKPVKGQKLIPGSLVSPLEDLPTLKTKLNKSLLTIVYCANYECPAAREAAELLKTDGFNVLVYEGGIREWIDSGLPSRALH